MALILLGIKHLKMIRQLCDPVRHQFKNIILIFQQKRIPLHLKVQAIENAEQPLLLFLVPDQYNISLRELLPQRIHTVPAIAKLQSGRNIIFLTHLTDIQIKLRL